MLGIEINVTTDCLDLQERLPDIFVHPVQERFLTGHAHYEVSRKDDRYRIFHDGEDFLTRPDTDLAILYLHELINYHFRSKFCRFPAIHSACATFGGKVFIVVADKAAGKTTLMCKLLFSGADIHSDEHVFLKKHMIVPYPRKFHLKESTIGLIPKLSAVCGGLKPYPISTGGTFYFFDPYDAGYLWKTVSVPLAAVFYLEPNHGGQSGLERMPKIQLVERVMHQVDNFSHNPSLEIREICDTINEVDSFLLRIGDLEAAVGLIREALR